MRSIKLILVYVIMLSNLYAGVGHALDSIVDSGERDVEIGYVAGSTNDGPVNQSTEGSAHCHVCVQLVKEQHEYTETKLNQPFTDSQTKQLVSAITPLPKKPPKN